jgi:hypothetical protein
VPANGQRRRLIHETGYALAVDYLRYSGQQAEVIVDRVVFCPVARKRRLGHWPQRQ